MSKLLLWGMLVLIALAPVAGIAQNHDLKGYIRHLEKDEPVPFADIINTRNGQHVQADGKGWFSIPVIAGDQLQISRVGIRTQMVTVTESMFSGAQRIYIEYDTGELQEVSVSGLTIYQRDSLARDSLYRPTLARKKDKLKVYVSPIGVGFERPFSSWMQHLAPKTKRKWKFQKNFAKWEAEQFVTTIYTRELVTQITGLSGEDCVQFMNRYPMPPAMARSAKELELKAWVKANYQDYKTRKK